MNNRPKRSDYAASTEETTLGRIASDQNRYYQQKYAPKLRQAMQSAMRDDFTSARKGRAQADTMQALTNRPSLQAARSVDAAADMASAATAQQLQGDIEGTALQRSRQTGILGLAQGEANDATRGLSEAARVATTSQLADAQNKQMVREARLGAATSLAGTLGVQGMENIAGGGTFFTPKAVSGGLGSVGNISGNLARRFNVGVFGQYDPSTGTYTGLGTDPYASNSYEGLAISAPSSSIMRGGG